MCPKKIEEDVASVVKAGESVELIEHAGQSYVLVKNLPAPTPPWEQCTHDIVIAIPAAYETAGLDGFYLKLPYKFGAAEHPRVNGPVIGLAGSSFKLVSWHYAEGNPWLPGQDDLGSHIVHCKGFFYHRKATSGY